VLRVADDNSFVHVLITHDDVGRPTDLEEVRSGRPSSPGSRNASRAPLKLTTRRSSVAGASSGSS
jgi:hypothetical protein